MDNIKIQILVDGTIKIETDKVSAPNHSNAENFLREIYTLAGGEVSRKGKHGLTHSHIEHGQTITHSH